MSHLAHPVGVDALPQTLPVFPLAGVLLLPRGELPLNIFEPRYLAMTRDVMVGDRLIGMVQPLHPDEEGGRAPAVYETGCAGRITEFEETNDGRYLITLTGVCRFVIAQELPLTPSGYRRVRAAYGGFAGDLGEPAADVIDQPRLLRALRACLAPDGEASIDWAAIEQMTDDSLVTSLAMMFPFAPSEKQALLEAPDTRERAGILTALMEMMAVADTTGGNERGLQ